MGLGGVAGIVRGEGEVLGGVLSQEVELGHLDPRAVGLAWV